MGFAADLEAIAPLPKGRRCLIAGVADALGSDGPAFIAAVEDDAVSTGVIRLALARRLDPDRHDDADAVAARLAPLDIGSETRRSGRVAFRSSRSLLRHRAHQCRCRR